MRRLVCFCLIVLFSLRTQAQSAGAIDGVVIDENRRPVAKAQVHVGEVDGQPQSRALRMYETSADGKFLIEGLQWGKYMVFAGKEEDGYPDPKFAFYNNLAAPTVSLAPNIPRATVNVQLGPKAGILDVSSVLDGITKKKLSTASITLRRVANPSFFIQTSTTVGRILVPSSTPVTIEVEASGYDRWPGPNSTKEINLKPEEVMAVHVELHPIQTPKSTSSY